MKRETKLWYALAVGSVAVAWGPLPLAILLDSRRLAVFSVTAIFLGVGWVLPGVFAALATRRVWVGIAIAIVLMFAFVVIFRPS